MTRTSGTCQLTLMIRLLDSYEMPIVPLESTEALATTLTTYLRQLSAGHGSRQVPNPAISLLPYCSIHPPLPEHTVNILSDLTSDLRDLVNKLSTHEGRQSICSYLGDDGEMMIRFWEDEYALD